MIMACVGSGSAQMSALIYQCGLSWLEGNAADSITEFQSSSLFYKYDSRAPGRGGGKVEQNQH